MFNEYVLERKIEKELGVRVKLAISTEEIDVTRLTPREAARFKQLEATPRCHSWLIGRSALKRLLADLGEDEETSDVTFPNPRYSVTHSGNSAVTVGTTWPTLLGIGIDLELNRTPHPESARFFLTDEERAWVTKLPVPSRARHLLRLWTIKEALFKSNPNNHNTGFSDYWLEDPGEESGMGHIINEGLLAMRYSTFQLKEGFLTVATCA